MGKLWNGRKRTKAGLKSDYAKFQSSSDQKKKRAKRNKNRREFEREGKVRKGDGKAIDHKDSNPNNNSKSNLRVVSRSENAGKSEDSRKKKTKRRK
jgi:hypothetical protein